MCIDVFEDLLGGLAASRENDGSPARRRREAAAAMLPVRMQMTQRMISARPCSSRKIAGQRDQRLERIDRRTGRAVDADSWLCQEMLRRNSRNTAAPASPGREKDEEATRSMPPGPWTAQPVDEVAADVAVARQGIGPGHHEQRAVHDVVMSYAQPVGALKHVSHERRRSRSRTSRMMMHQANALPTPVLRRSMNSRSCFPRPDSPPRLRRSAKIAGAAYAAPAHLAGSP